MKRHQQDIKDKSIEKKIKVNLDSENNTSVKLKLEQIKTQLYTQDDEANYVYKNDQIEEFKVIMKQIDEKLDSIKTKNAFLDLIKMPEMIEQQFIQNFIKSIEENEIHNRVDTELESQRTECWKKLELQSNFFKGKLQLNRDYTYSNYFDMGYSNIYFIDDDDNQLILQRYELADDNQNRISYGQKELINEINSKTYNSDLIHIKNLNTFIDNLIKILPQEKQINFNKEKLFQFLTGYFKDLQDSDQFDIDYSIFKDNE